MLRFTPVSKFRPATSAILCLIFLTALVWPAASLWTSYGQTLRVEAQPDASSGKRTDVLAKLLDSGMRPNALRQSPSGNSLLRSPLQETANLLVPTITASKVDALFTDVDMDGRADPGDTLQYTITVNNAGTDATGVKFTDSPGPNLTLVAGSLNSSPIAFDDTAYTATGNVRISVSAANGVLTNDIDPDTQSNAGLTASAGATSANGGNVVMSANGSFTYNPPTGFTGTDTFTYTVTDSSGATGTGTVSFNVSGMIWFVQAGAPSGGDGRLTSPFNCLVGAGCFDPVAADDPGDNIFLYSGNYTGGLTLLANQRLIGQGATASLATITGLTPPTGSDALPATGGTRPAITTTAATTSAVTVGSGNTLRGFNIGNTTAVDITGTGIGTLTIADMELNGTGRLLNLTNGTLAATFDNLTATTAPGGSGVTLNNVGGTLTVNGTTSIAGAGGQGIHVLGSSVAANFGTSTSVTDPAAQGILIVNSTGNVSFGNTTVTLATDSISLQNNSAGTRSFGTIQTTDGTGAGFLHALAGGTVTVSGTTTITNPTARGIDIQDSTTTITFANVNVTQSGSTGVFIDDTSGAVTFGDLDISPDAAQRALHVTDQTGTLTTTTGTIATTTTGIPVEIVGTSAANRTPLAVVLERVDANGAANGIVVTNTSGTFAVNGTGTTAGSGGTIQNITNRGASFIDANGITLKNMNLTNVGTTNGADPTNPNSTCGGLENGLGGNTGCNAGVHMVNVTSMTMDRLVLNGGAQQGVNGSNVTNLVMSNSSVLNFGDQTRECGFRLKNLLGASSLTSVTATGNEENQLRVVNTQGTLSSFNVTSSTFSTSAVGNGVSGIQFEGTGTAVMNINVQSCTMSNNAADGFFSSGTDTSTVNVTVNNSTFQNNGNAAINVNAVSGANGQFTITNNPTITGHVGNSINVNLGLPSTGTLQGTISGNTIVGSLAVGAGGSGIRVVSNGSGNIHTVINGNNISNILTGSGIDVLARDGSSDLNATIRSNTINLNTASSLNGIFVQSGATNTDTTAVCADIGGAGGLANNIQNTTGNHAIRIRNRFPSTTFRLPGFAGNPSSEPDAVSHLAARNTVNGDLITATLNLNTWGAGGACTQPSARFDEANASLPSQTTTETDALDASVSNERTIATHKRDAELAHTNDAAAKPYVGSMLLNHARSTATRLANKVQEERHLAQDGMSKVKQPDVKVEGQEGNQETKDGTDGEPVITVGGANGFTLPANKSFTITFRATIATGVLPAFTQVSNQGTVSGSNFASVLTDDPDAVGASNPTVTNIDHTTVAVSSSANPSVFGQNVTFTATMTGVPVRAGDPPGTVQFKADGNNIGSPVPVVVGTAGDNVSTAQASIDTLSVGTHVITAEYSGGGSGPTGYNANTGTLTGGQVVGKASTTVGVTSSQNPSVFGQPVTFTATVAAAPPGAGSPSGTVNFLDAGNPITGCQNVALQSGQAQCQPGSLSVGNHTITVDYSGDASFNTSNGSLTGNPQVVNKADTTLGLTSSQNPAPQGTSITFTATVGVTAPGAGAPTGTVQFLDGMNPIAGCTMQTVTAGQATCMTSALTVGNHTITAVYSGDGSFNTSTGSLTGNPQVITGPPSLNPTVGLTRQQGSAATNSQIATVSDDVSNPGAVTVTAMTVPTGISVTNIVNTNGNITADIEALCNAATGDNTIVLEATDGKTLETTANLVINVTANTAPTLGNYANNTIVLDCKTTITPDAAPTDNGTVASVMATGSMGFSGIINVDAATGAVTISNSGPVGMHTITVTATDNCGSTFQRMFTLTVTAPPTAPTDYDFDGDRKADVSVYRPGATEEDFSYWFILKSSDNSLLTVQFGHDADKLVPGDYDGDGDTDVAVYRPSISTWFTSQDPMTNYGAFQWGQAGDIPVPGFYDNDAKTDIAVFRPSNGNWYIAKSTGGTETRAWGQTGDKLIPADYDGDGMTDVGIWRPSDGLWRIQLSGGGTITQAWGLATDILVPADYDGDGEVDMAVWRPSTGFWFILQSTGGARIEEWGQTGDVPTPADYDNDGKADLAVYRTGEGAWYIFNSCPCTLRAQPFGIATDTPVPAAFTPPAGP